ncbi:uncharacterized protein LOC131852654 [Achroia grisella]|uniref:uncharacterized protein LOC131844003 n=1 Tax=Achroia grisella TaxID=688607 RepID=UPI0027D34C50|nr:uncharacterized protein LOC131844003 [Achroia grisella]XP_059059338.1 uncharacterized protein LOC131852654 [Achroia grisella]
MERSNYVFRNCIINNNESEIIEILNCGFDPNLEGGWPIRLAARHGRYSIVKLLLQHGANPHLLSASGASTLQLAVYSSHEWESDSWSFLLSCCDSSQLADGAAVAIIFQNVTALKKILETGRCNTNIPTTLTGKTVEDLAKGYKLQCLLNTAPFTNNYLNVRTPVTSPRISRQSRPDTGNLIALQQSQQVSNLSPSVARFFHQTAAQTSLTPPRNNLVTSSPTVE